MRTSALSIILSLLLTLSALASPSSLDLQQAIRNGEVDKVNQILASGFDPLSRDINGDTAAHAAANAGRVELLKRFLDLGISPDAVNQQGRTLLYEATLANSADCCRLLLSRGASLESPGPAWSPFQAALVWGEDEAALVLMEAGAEVNAPFDDGETPLMLASQRGPFKVVQALLARKADPSPVNANRESALHYAARGGETEAVSLLLARGLDPLAISSSGQSPLSIAFHRQFEPLAQMLLDHSDSTLALPTVVAWGSPQQVSQLINAGAVPENDALVVAAGRGQVALELTRVLLQAGAAFDSGNSIRALHAACRRESLDMVDFLLARGVDPNSSDEQGNLPLLTACDLGNTELVERLLDAGASPSVRGPNGLSGTERVERRIRNLQQTLEHYGRYRCLHPAEADARRDLEKILAARPRIRQLLQSHHS